MMQDDERDGPSTFGDITWTEPKTGKRIVPVDPTEIGSVITVNRNMIDKITAASPINSIIPAPGTFVVRMLKQSGVTTGGIHLPEQQSEAPNQAIVVYAGESTYNKGIEFMPKVGDRISMKRFGFSEVLVNGETLRQVGANDILGILL